jgi:hypothetical protein
MGRACRTTADRSIDEPSSGSRAEPLGERMDASLMKRALVPLMIAASGAFMASAWLAHLRFKDRIGFGVALLVSWSIVLPEYALNVAATRYGFGTYTGAQMAAFHLCSGVVCVALVSRFVLGEAWGARQMFAFAFLAAGMWLLLHREAHP